MNNNYGNGQVDAYENVYIDGYEYGYEYREKDRVGNGCGDGFENSGGDGFEIHNIYVKITNKLYIFD